MYGVVVGLFKMSNKSLDEDSIDDCVDEILEAVDANGDGVITEWEFINNALKSPFLKNLVGSEGCDDDNEEDWF